MPIDRSVDNQHLMTILMYTYSAYLYYCIEHEMLLFTIFKYYSIDLNFWMWFLSKRTLSKIRNYNETGCENKL